MNESILEGTWEEIRANEARLAGHRVRVTILDAGTKPSMDFEKRFLALADQWRAATAHLSSPSQIAMHPAYQEIIGMGFEAVPFILRDLERRPDPWFWALKAITREDPVGVADRGKAAEMAKRWIDWGKRRGLLA